MVVPLSSGICNKCSTTGATYGAGTVYPSSTTNFTAVLIEVRVSRSLVFFVVFCGSWFVLWSFLLCCLSFFDLRLLQTFLKTYTEKWGHNGIYRQTVTFNNPLLTNKLFYTSRRSHYLSKNQLMTWTSKRMLCIWFISHNYFSIYFQMFLNLSEYDYNVQCFKTLRTPVICHVTRWTHYADTKSSIVCFHVYCSKYQYHCLPFNTTGIDLIISRNHYKSTDYLLRVYIELLY